MSAPTRDMRCTTIQHCHRVRHFHRRRTDVRPADRARAGRVQAVADHAGAAGGAEIAGVLNLRGRIVTTIDMRRRLDLSRREDERSDMAIGIEAQRRILRPPGRRGRRGAEAAGCRARAQSDQSRRASWRASSRRRAPARRPAAGRARRRPRARPARERRRREDARAMRCTNGNRSGLARQCGVERDEDLLGR